LDQGVTRGVDDAGDLSKQGALGFFKEDAGIPAMRYVGRWVELEAV